MGSQGLRGQPVHFHPWDVLLVSSGKAESLPTLLCHPAETSRHQFPRQFTNAPHLAAGEDGVDVGGVDADVRAERCNQRPREPAQASGTVDGRARRTCVSVS